jgi:transposase
MIPSNVDVFLALEPVSMHLSFDRLAGLVTERMGRSARAPALYVFINRRRTRLKALFFDGTGLCLFYKRLDRGRFRVPEEAKNDVQVLEMSEGELEELLDGLAVKTVRDEPPPTVH